MILHNPVVEGVSTVTAPKAPAFARAWQRLDLAISGKMSWRVDLDSFCDVRRDWCINEAPQMAEQGCDVPLGGEGAGGLSAINCCEYPF